MNALNQLRQAQAFTRTSCFDIRPIANLGSKAMLKRALDIDEQDPSYDAIRQQFLSIYMEHLADSTQLFPNMEKVLAHLEQHSIPWGIVTNKLTVHTMGLLKAFSLDQRTDCIICGDTLEKTKPNPLPLLHACQLLGKEPPHCIYVGDAESDVIASKAAGIQSLVALYGYINQDENPTDWKADGYVREPIEIIEWL